MNMLYVFLILLIIINAFWLVLVIFGLPGNWLMVITTMLFAWWRWDDHIFSMWTLAAVTVLAAVGELLEFLAGLAGAKSAGGTWRGAAAALVGGIIGAVAGTFIIPLPILGTLIGSAAGAALAAWAAELTGGKKMEPSIKTGVGAGVGRIAGTLAKIAVGVIIWVVLAAATLWP